MTLPLPTPSLAAGSFGALSSHSPKESPMAFAQSWLSTEQIGQLRNELERNLHRLQRSLLGRSGQSREIDQTAVGRLSRVEALQNRGFKEKLEERETTHFDEV